MSAQPSRGERRKEITRIVRRLEAIVTNHLEGARRSHHPLARDQFLAVVDALHAEATGDARPVPFSNYEVSFYLMDGLYEELLGEPSNIFSATPGPDGVTRLEPLHQDFWLDCLAALRRRLDSLRLTGG